MGWYSWRRYYFCKGRRFISNDEESFSIHSGDGFYHLPWARHGVRPVNVDNARFLLRLPRPTSLRRQPCGGRHNTKGHCHPRASSALRGLREKQSIVLERSKPCSTMGPLCSRLVGWGTGGMFIKTNFRSRDSAQLCLPGTVNLRDVFCLKNNEVQSCD